MIDGYYILIIYSKRVQFNQSNERLEEKYKSNKQTDKHTIKVLGRRKKKENTDISGSSIQSCIEIRNREEITANSIDKN